MCQSLTSINLFNKQFDLPKTSKNTPNIMITLMTMAVEFVHDSVGVCQDSSFEQFTEMRKQNVNIFRPSEMNERLKC